MKVDLHTHTTFSDGTLEPEDLVQSAHEMGITHLAIADHDSTGSLESARVKASELGMTVISGVEINTKDSISVHILGYFVDENDEGFQKILSRHRTLREKRAQMILGKLNRMGIKILLSDFNHRKESAAIGRPHIADKLKEKGIVFSRQEAFDKFLAQGRPAYASYEGPTPKDAIDTILSSKGVPVIAHPGYSVSNETIEALAKMGLAGIEVYYPSHNPEQIRNFLETAKRCGLIVTGGSDYHGPGSGHEKLGEVNVPESTIEELQERRVSLFG
jgi:predicted metal-dependent phosphoesterase TrpH